MLDPRQHPPSRSIGEETPCLQPAVPTPAAPATTKRLRCPVGTSSDVRFGSLADMGGRISDVRFIPKSGHAPDQNPCPLSAKSRHRATESAVAMRP
jgi:hypothetical protein